MSKIGSESLRNCWPARRQKMLRARYACPVCQFRFTFDCLVNGPRVPSHTAPQSAGVCSGTGNLLTRRK